MNITKQKLLFLITQGRWGGTQKYVYDLATALAGQFEITVAVGEPDGANQLQQKIQDACIACEIELIQLKHLRRHISPVHDLLAILEIKQLYEKIKPDLVHLNSSKAGILGSFAKWFMFHGSCVMIYTAHGWVFEESLPPWLKYLYCLAEKLTARAKNVIIILSEHDRQIAEQTLKVPPHKLAMIPNGITPGVLFSCQEARAQLGLPTDALIIGTIANHYKTKGLDVLIEAVAPLKKEIRDLHLVIIGDGLERPRLEAMIETFGLGALVHLSGFLPDAVKYLLAFDLFVLPSRKEGLPYTLLEAMHAGLPIIATTVGAIPTIITSGEHGLLVPPESPTALLSALQQLTVDRVYRDKLGLAAKRRASDFSLVKQIQATTTLYLSLLPPAAVSH